MSNKSLSGNLFRWLVVVILLIGISYNLLAARELASFSPYVQLEVEKESSQLNGQSASELLSKNAELTGGYSFVVWGKKQRETLESKEVNKAVEADVLALQGNSQILFPQAPGLLADNQEACLISSPLARALFGGTAVKGMAVTYKKRNYHVLSVIPDKRAFFVYESSDSQTRGLNRLTLLSKPKVNKVLLKQALKEQLGIDSQIIDYDGVRIILVGLNCLLLIWLIASCLYGGIQSGKHAFCEGKMPKEGGIMGLVVVMSVGLLFLFLKYGAVASDYLPTRLSELAFINQQLTNLTENILRLVQSDKYASEFRLIGHLVAMAIVTLLVIVVSLLYGLMAALVKIKQVKGKRDERV